MKLLFIFLILFCNLAIAGSNPYCNDFRKIKDTMVKLDRHGVERVLPDADWLDDRHRRQDRNQVVGIVAKTVILTLLKRLSALSYMFEPTRVGVSSFTGYYVSSPENFARFLQLPTKSACQYLSMGDRHADILRELTREVRMTLDRARRR